MVGASAIPIPTPLSLSLSLSPLIPRIFSLRRISNPTLSLCQTHYFSLLVTCPLHFSPHKHSRRQTHFSPNASSSSSVVGAEYTEEPATAVKFQRSLSLPGCSGSLSLLGTGYREKSFAIIGVKVYAAGLYVNPSILSELNAWKGQSTTKFKRFLPYSTQFFNLLWRNHYRLFWLEMLMVKLSGMPLMMPSPQESKHPLPLMNPLCPHSVVSSS